jgi:membrane protein YdbS with pleckstrin-like domain
MRPDIRWWMAAAFVLFCTVWGIIALVDILRTSLWAACGYGAVFALYLVCCIGLLVDAARKGPKRRANEEENQCGPR